ncbi:FadR/GntR family transcriptional regulator [Teredinibacter purpureus]|uniref:FadR/GntR family transcriptional regulator n=1 Tax=Teredinibacter purpureus TaxID=2731756 RepID=UPI0005F7A76C|nr:FadR/GntR family transcriptional regulator [Teredinibacter purpureus]
MKVVAVLDKNFNLSYRMAQELGRAIICGEFKSHDSLPTEAELCEKFGVSRTAVREAVKMLSAKGLIASKPRQGIRVLPEEDWNIFDADLLRWSLEGNPSMQVLKEFLQMRIAIEPEAAALAARNTEPDRLINIASALERMGSAEEGSAEALEADIDFHISILYASDNRFYIRMRDFIRTALNVSIVHTNVIKGDFSATLEEHAKVYRAIENQDAPAAKEAMLFLIDEALSFIESELQK